MLARGSDIVGTRPRRCGTAPVGTGRARLHTVDGADHALEVRGDWRRSLRLQADVLELVDRRIAALVS